MTLESETPPIWTVDLGRKPRRGDLLDVAIERIDHRGKGLGRVGPFQVGVRHGLPGSTLRVRVRRRRGDGIEGHVEEVLAPSPRAVAPRCAHFGVCGGCSFQDIDYAEQLVEKHHLVERLLSAVPRPPDVAIEPPLACESPWAYRNKMDFTFSSRRWIESDEPENAESGFALGLHIAGWHGKVLDLRECHIQPEVCGAVLVTARALAREQEIAPWDLVEHRGCLRHLVLRKSHACDDLLAYLVTSEETPAKIGPYVECLLAAHPEITTLVQGITSRASSVALGERDVVHAGPGTLRERLLGLEFAISARSFFQTNTPQAERLLEIVRAEADCGPADVVYDLYCGGGAIGLVLARDVREVWGFEEVEPAVLDARRNSAANGIANAFFVAGDVVDSLQPQHHGATRRPFPDVVVLDPPRAGLHPQVLEAVAGLRPRRVVYVSCNPRTAAGDLARFVESGLRLARIRPVDLFPHTPHIEVVATLVDPRHGR